MQVQALLVYLSLFLTASSAHTHQSQPSHKLPWFPQKHLLESEKSSTTAPGNTPRPADNGGHKASPPPECHFGTAPGMFDMNATAGERWQLFSEDCKLKNYLSQYNNPKQSSSLPPMSVLFMSDSMDMKLLLAYCDFSKRKVDHSLAHIKYNQCSGEDKGPLSVAQIYLPSMTDRPKVFIIDNYPILGGYKTKITAAKKKWAEDHNGGEPKVVVLGGGLWDIFRWLKAPSEDLAAIERTVRQNKEISLELLSWWTDEVKKAIRFVRNVFPNAKLVWRTFATPSYNLDTGMTHNANIGNKAYVVQMRSAGWAAALDEGVEVVDVDAMVQEFPHPRHYLQDKHHAKPEVMLEVLNVIINIGLSKNGGGGGGGGGAASPGATSSSKDGVNKEEEFNRR